jgi:hypothetical protein
MYAEAERVVQKLKRKLVIDVTTMSGKTIRGTGCRLRSRSGRA